ncbi:MAG: YicC/YloC family endoribonuclease [Candidatus Aminicenantia bacterium]
MIKSMTGFCEKKFNFKTFSANITIKTLNHRYFDWYFKGNFVVAGLEYKFRALAQKEFSRGRIEVNFDLEFFSSSNWHIHIDNNLLDKVLTSFGPIFNKYKNIISFPLDSVFKLPGIFTLKPVNLRKDEVVFLERSFQEVMNEVIKQREKEGKTIKKEIVQLLNNIHKKLKKIEFLAQKQPQIIQKKLNQRIKDFGQEELISPERLAEEIFFYVQKCDITEEISRIKSHLEYLNNMLNSDMKEPVGKKIDFLIQEIHREIHTLSAKSQDLTIIRQTIEIKGELEKIKQQIQNIE